MERANLSRYLPPQVVDLITSKGGSVELGGVLQPVTVLFADIRGFTSLSEQMDAREVVDLLNDFFGVMTAAIFQSNGTLDKFIGDCVMALFGAPIPSERSPRNALVAAVRMQQQVARLGEERVQRGLAPIRIGIGLHHGPAVVGNIGSAERMQYTAIGDTVNIAARLVSRAEPGQILVSEAMYKAAGGSDLFHDLGQVSVKGRDAQVRVYSVDWERIVQGNASDAGCQPRFVSHMETGHKLQIAILGRSRIHARARQGHAGVRRQHSVRGNPHGIQSGPGIRRRIGNSRVGTASGRRIRRAGAFAEPVSYAFPLGSHSRHSVLPAAVFAGHAAQRALLDFNPADTAGAGSSNARLRTFPLSLAEAGARVSFAQLKSERVKIGDVSVESFPLNHPQGAYGYRIEADGKSIVYATDLEHGDVQLDRVLRDYASGADVLIYDAQYNDEEYASHRGWGHSTWREATRVARDADVGKLFLFHFDPAHTDARVAESERLAAAEFEEACAAREGSVILL